MHPDLKTSENRSKRALLLYGGWDGHQPECFADFAEDKLLGDFDVVRSQDLEMLRPDVLAGFDLLVPIWTFGEITDAQETALLSAVADGMGMVAWHGNASSFLDSRPHKLMLGGQFVAHPGGNYITYSVRFLGNDPLVDGLKDVTITSEQYYFLIDPAVKVLATTGIDGGDMDWIADVRMPVAWKRKWGKGRVFYCGLGHTLDVLEEPCITTLLSRAVSWACRSAEEHCTGTAKKDRLQLR
jgi:type 1 glutamine amidotransferase